MLRRHPQVIAALAARGITDLGRVLTDVWAYGAALVPPQLRRPADRLGRCLVPVQRGRQPVRAQPDRAASRGRPELDAAAGAGGQRRRRPARGHGRVPAAADPRAAARGQRPRGQSARRSVVHARRQAAAVAELGAADRLQSPRGTGAAHRRLPRQRPAAPGRAPDVVRRDDRAVPGRDHRPLPPDGIRHRRVGPGVHDHLARARLRLPGRDPVPGRGRARLARRAARDRQRDLHPRGRRRHPVEARGRAHRRADPARAPARSVVPRDRGQLRVPGLLALLPGREHRVRGAGHRHHGDLVFPGRRAAGHRRARRRADLRALSPAFHRGPARPRHRRAAQHRLRLRLAAAPGRRRQSARAGAGGPRDAAADGTPMAGRTTTGRPSAAGRSPRPGPPADWASSPPTSWCRAAASRR